MIKILSILSLLLFSPLCSAEVFTKEKKQAIDELVAITGALEVSEMLGKAVANQVIAAMMQQNQSVDKQTIAIIQDEIGSVMYDEFIANGFLINMLYELYHKHFSTLELQEIVAFYKTDTGKKMANLLPELTQEGMQAGQLHGQSLGPTIERRLRARFEKEGIL